MILYTSDNKPKVVYINEDKVSLLNEYGWNPTYYSMDDSLEFSEDPYARLDKTKQNGKKRNFAIKRNGEEYWVSRSSVVTLLAFCKDKNGEWYILANQRGKNTRYGGVWNFPGGYLDYGESLEQAAVRECYEECGVNVGKNKVILWNVDSEKHGGYSSVKHNFVTILDGTIENYPPIMNHCEGFGTEKQEVQNVAWIPLSQLRKTNIRKSYVNIALDVAKKILSSTSTYNELYITLNDLVKRGLLDNNKYSKIINILKL